MSDITSEQFERFISEIKGTTGVLDRISKTMHGNGQSSTRAGNASANRGGSSVLRGLAGKTLERDMGLLRAKENRHREESSKAFSQHLVGMSNKLGRSFQMLDSSSSDFGRSLLSATKSVAGFGLITGVIEGLIDVGENWIKQYRDLVDVGQQFGGSMMDMARQAADAGLPLNEFAQYVKKNSQIMASFGVKDVTGLAKSVRIASRQVGLYGFSVEGMNDLSAEWLDIQRIMGNRQAATSASSIGAIEGMARDVTGLSAVFGESRDELIKKTKEFASSNDIVLATLNDTALKGNKSFQQTLTGLAALPGDAGKTMQDLFAGMLNHGTVAFSETGKAMTEAGLTEVNSIIQNYAEQIKGGGVDGIAALDETMQKMQGVFRNHAASLQLLSAANPGVANLIGTFKSMEGFDLSKVRDKQNDEMTKTTAGILSLGERINDIKGKLLYGFLTNLEILGSKLSDLGESPAWDKFLDAVQTMGAKIGNMVSSFFVKHSAEDMANWLTGFADKIIYVTEVLLKVATAFLSVASFAIDVVDGFFKLSSVMGENGPVIASLMAFAAYVGGKALISNLFRGGPMSVAAGVVYVNGTAVGGVGAAGAGAGAGAAGAGAAAAGAETKLLGRMGKSLGRAASHGALAAGAALLIGGAMYGISKLGGSSDVAAPPSTDYNAEIATNTARMVERQDVTNDQLQKNGLAPDVGGSAVPVDQNGNVINIRDGNFHSPLLDEQPPIINTPPAPATQAPQPNPQPNDNPGMGEIAKTAAMGALQYSGIVGVLGLSKKLLTADTEKMAANNNSKLIRDYRAKHLEHQRIKREVPLLGKEEKHVRRLEKAEQKLSLAREKAHASNAALKNSTEHTTGKLARTQAYFANMGKKIRSTKLGGMAVDVLEKNPRLAKFAKGAAGGIVADLVFEGLSYYTGDKKITGKNIAKSALRVGGAAIGGGIAGMFSGGIGTTIGATGGMFIGDGLGQLVLGDDDYNTPEPKKAGRAPAQKDIRPEQASIESKNKGLEQAQRRTQAVMEERLPTPQQTAQAQMQDADMLTTLHQTRDVTIAVLARLNAHSKQFHDIWSEIKNTTAAVKSK